MRPLKRTLTILAAPAFLGLASMVVGAALAEPRSPVILEVQAREDIKEREEERSSDPRPSEDRAWLGIELQNLDENLRDAFDFKGSGVLVAEVVTGSPADRAGIEKGDIIVRVDGRRVKNPSQIVRRIQLKDPGDEVEITRVRKGREGKVKAKLAAAPERLGMRRSRDSRFPFDGAYLGARVEAVSADLAPYFQVEPKGGVLVVAIDEDSPAEKAGLKAGDVIIEMNGERVGDPEDLVRKIREEESGTKVTLTAIRHGKEQRLEATLAEAPAWDRLRRLTRLRGDLEPMMDGLRERMREGRDALSERVEKLEGLIRNLERRVEELSERKER